VDTLHVIADDLTGACDVAAALLPWPGDIAVLPDGVSPSGHVPAALAVRNTQSRTLPPADAAGRVRATLAPLARGGGGLLLKKIDTGLRGPLGAEIDAALDAMGARRAFVLPAIPEAGRTTVAGEQRVGGVAVHRTAFADDPHNPVRDGRVAAVIESTARRKAVSIGLDVVRRPGAVRAALARCDDPIVVFDAETDRDLGETVAVLLDEPGPLVLVGSTGLARAVRSTLSPAAVDDRGAAATPATGRGVLVVQGSAHPVARAQRRHAEHAGELAAVIPVSPAAAERAGGEAARIVAAGGAVALVAPDTLAVGGELAVAGALQAAVRAALAVSRPAGLVLVGGETAFHVLAGLGHPPLTIATRLATLVVQGYVADGPHRGLAVVTKGGSSGEPELLATLLRRLGGRGA
jgi:uncharacterized protein YgbK (DUF1537 family)